MSEASVSDFTEVKKLVDGIKTAHESFKAANDSEIKSVASKQGELALIVKTLEEKLVDLEAKSLRQTQVAKLDEVTHEELKAFNYLAKQAGRPQLDEARVKDYALALEGYLHTGGKLHVLGDTQTKTLEEGFDSRGGYWVMPQMASAIVKKIWETSPMRDVASVVTTNTDRYGYFIDFDEFDAAYVRELKTRAVTDTSVIAKRYIDVHTLYVKVPVSTELLEDSSQDLTSFIQLKAADKIARIRNNNYVNGNGSNKEFGIFSPVAPTSGAGVYGEVERVATAGTAVAYDDLIGLFASLKNDYHTNASILMSRQMLLNKFLTIKDGEDRYIVDIWNRPGGIPMTLAGYPVKFMQDMPLLDTTASQDLLAFGDFRRAYTIVDRRGLIVLRDPYTLDGGVYFKIDSRGGAAVTNTEAYKILRRKA